jgi:hypothetical protein
MSPALLAVGVFLRQVLRVIDKNVGAFSKLAHVLVEHGIAGLVIGRVDHNLVPGL